MRLTPLHCGTNTGTTRAAQVRRRVLEPGTDRQGSSVLADGVPNLGRHDAAAEGVSAATWSLEGPDRQNVVVAGASSAGDADAGEQGHHLQAERLVVRVDVGPAARGPADPRVGDAGQQRRDDLCPGG